MGSATKSNVEFLRRHYEIPERTFLFSIPFSAVVTWALHTLDTVGESSVNPFEGSANDVPITQISRTMEIDMRDMFDESTIPAPIVPKNDIVM